MESLLLNYLEAGSLIVERLKEQMTDIRAFASLGLTKIDEIKDPTPYLMVFLESDLPGDGLTNGCEHKVEQSWCVILASSESNEESGFLISRTIASLAGWRPGKRFKPLARVQTIHVPDWSPSGVFYFPMAFTTGFVFNVADQQ